MHPIVSPNNSFKPTPHRGSSHMPAHVSAAPLRGGLTQALGASEKSMAIVILRKTLCPLCGHVISDGHETVATSHFIETPSHPLWRYSDAAMHYECFQAWQHREDFVAEYNNTIGLIVTAAAAESHRPGA
jgi:hypothetical protein